MSEYEAQSDVTVDAVEGAGFREESRSAEIADEELMIRYARGDSGAFEILYERYKGPVYRFILRSVGEKSAAEDLFHDVMIRVVGAAERYKPTAKFNTWLFSIARNACIDASRKRKFEPTRRLSDPVSGDSGDMVVGDTIADDARLQDEAASDSETKRALDELIDVMNPEQKEVFLLREVEGMSFADISKVVGVKESTAKSRMRYALDYLADGLRKRGIYG